MKTFKEFIEKQYLFEIHAFSNSGKADYGIKCVLYFKELLPRYHLRPKDIVLFRKKCSELTFSDLKKYATFLRNQFNLHKEMLERRESYKEAQIQYIESNIELIKKLYHLRGVNITKSTI